MGPSLGNAVPLWRDDHADRVLHPKKQPLAPRNNIVDLAEYRRRLEAVQPEEEQVPAPFQPRQRRSRRRQLWGLFWDACAGMGILLMTLTFTLRVLTPLG